MATVKFTRAISVDLNYTFNRAYIICRFELHKCMKLMREFKRNAALRYVRYAKYSNLSVPAVTS